MERTKQTVISLALIAAGFVGVYFLSALNERVHPPLPPGIEDEDLAVQSGRARGFMLGLEGSVADWYWLQSLQYVGGKLIRANETGVGYSIDDLKPLNPRLLYPLLDAATTYDPQFIAAYSYGAVVMPAIDPDLAIRLTEKGIAANPGQWRLYQHLGFIYWKLGNYEKAAEVYLEGSRVPGAPNFFTMMAAQMKSKGGSRDTARAIYRQMLDGAEDSQTKEIATLRLNQLEAFDELDAVKAELEKFRAKNGRCASGWPEITALLRPVKLPSGDFRIDNRSGALADPTGVPYLFDKSNCVVTLDVKNSKIPIQ